MTVSCSRSEESAEAVLFNVLIRGAKSSVGDVARPGWIGGLMFHLSGILHPAEYRGTEQQILRCGCEAVGGAGTLNDVQRGENHLISKLQTQIQGLELITMQHTQLLDDFTAHGLHCSRGV